MRELDELEALAEEEEMEQVPISNAPTAGAQPAPSEENENG